MLTEPALVASADSCWHLVTAGDGRWRLPLLVPNRHCRLPIWLAHISVRTAGTYLGPSTRVTSWSPRSTVRTEHGASDPMGYILWARCSTGSWWVGRRVWWEALPCKGNYTHQWHSWLKTKQHIYLHSMVRVVSYSFMKSGISDRVYLCYMSSTQF